MVVAERPLICPILVGRDDLLELRERRLRQAADGRGHLLFLAGEADIGKTRWLEAIVRSARTRLAACRIPAVERRLTLIAAVRYPR